ncbi:MAG: CHAT domain-containing protein [Chitinophagales bacterium]
MKQANNQEQKMESYRSEITRFYDEGKFDTCLQLIEEVDFFLKEEGFTESEWQIVNLNLKGKIFYRQSNYDSAKESYQLALEIQSKLSQPKDSELVKSLLGMAQVNLGKGVELVDALYYLEKALSTAKKTNLLVPLPFIYNSTGLYYSYTANFDKAIEHFNLAIEAEVNVSGKISSIAYHTNIAACYRKNGDYEEALNYCYKALNILNQNDDQDSDKRAVVFALLGSSYIYKTQFDKGLIYCQRALELWTSIFGEKHPNIASVSDKMAFAYFYQKRYDEALPFYEKSLEIYQFNDENSLQTGCAHQRLGRCLFKKGDNEVAFSHYLKSKVLLERIKYSPFHLISTYTYMADYERVKEDFESSLQYFQKGIILLLENFSKEDVYSLPEIESCYSSQKLFKIIYNKAATFYEKYQKSGKNFKDLLAANRHYEYTDCIIKLLRKDYQDTSNELFSQEVNKIYEQSIAVSKELFEQTQDSHYLSNCFSISEQEKVHLLRTAITDAAAKSKARIPKTLLKKEESLRREITRLQDVILKGGIHINELDEMSAVSHKNQIFDLKRENQQLITQFEKDYPEYHQLKYSDYTASVEDVQMYLLQRNSYQKHLFISYFVGEQNIYIFKMSAVDCQMYAVEKPSHFAALVKDFNTAITTVELEDYMDAGSQLYTLLLAPLQLQMDKNTSQSLTILRHDVLHYLSFDALFFPIDNERIKTAEVFDFHDLDYLVYHFNIAYHYSATLLLQGEMRNAENRQREDSFLGLAPVSFAADSKTTLLAMETHRGESKIFRSNQLGKKALANLPNTAIEVNEVYQLFNRQKLSAKAFLYGAASKKNFFQEAPKHKYLLVATHGFNYDGDGNLSGIYLANEREWEGSKKNTTLSMNLNTSKKSNSTTSEDISPNGRSAVFESEASLLTTTESYLLRLNADLVVLSSCSSGIGVLQKGEGMMGLHRGFLYAGASNIVFTQFDIPDETSSLLVKKLFEYILEDKNYALALKKAKLHILQQEGVTPQDWAAFALIGG